MKDKEMIEEMAYMCCRLSNKPLGCSTCMWRKNCNSYENATKYVEQGYRKLPKDSVVLTREEYNKVDNIFKMSISDHIAYLRDNERLKEDVQALIGTRFNRFNLITQEESDKQIQQVIKETAEKFAKTIFEKFSYDPLTHEPDEDIEIHLTASELFELAKQVGVEIKE